LDEEEKKEYGDLVSFTLDRNFTQEEIAKISHELSQKEIGCTIIGNRFESTNYGEKSLFMSTKLCHFEKLLVFERIFVCCFFSFPLFRAFCSR